LKREGSLRRSFKTEQKRPSVAEVTSLKPPTAVEDSSKSSISERSIPITKAGVTIEEITAVEADHLESRESIATKIVSVATVSTPTSVPPSPAPQEETKKQSSVTIQEELSTTATAVNTEEKTEQIKSSIGTKEDQGPNSPVQRKSEETKASAKVEEQTGKSKVSLGDLDKEVASIDKKAAKKASQEARKTSTDVVPTVSVEEPSPEEIRKLRRRSSVIVGSIGMASEKPPVFATPLRSVECERESSSSLLRIRYSVTYLTKFYM
jgi:hypothetical protein